MTATFYDGDAIEVMAKLPEKSVDLVLSSPPFLALRSYLPSDHPDKSKEGGSQATPGEYIDWLVDVAEACARVLAPHGSLCFELGDTYAGAMPAYGYTEAHSSVKARTKTRRDGLENEILGITAGSDRVGPGWPLSKSLSLIPELFRLTLVYGVNPLTGRQTDRWRLRNVIRWVRPNPPVGALGDKFRPATSELMVFCKSAKRYFDLDAVREPVQHPGQRLPAKTPDRGMKYVGDRIPLGPYDASTSAGAPPLDWWEISLLDDEAKPYGPKPRDITKGIPNKALAHSPTKGNSWGDDETKIMYENPNGAPPLDWWNIPPGGYEGAHYAVFPPELCVKPIKAMCPEFVCKTCGRPRERITERTGSLNPERPQAKRAMQLAEEAGLTQEHIAAIRSFGIHDAGKAQITQTGAGKNSERVKQLAGEAKTVLGGYFREFLLEVPQTIGLSDCGCDGWCPTHDGTYWHCPKRCPDRVAYENDSDRWRPGLVLDPFAGSGTTLAVATGHGREAIGIDLDERNYDLALERVGPMFLQRGEVPA